MSEIPHVVIIGGGFAGLRAAREFEWSNVRVTLIDKRNHHLFQPLLYQVATAALSAPDIAAPIRKVLSHQRNATVLLGEVTDIEVDANRVVLADGEVTYDYLIVAAGLTNNYFGNDDWEALAPGLKTLDDALEIRRRILMSYEAAERITSSRTREPFLTFVVIGGGPTGVELAGALSEIATRTMTKNFRNFDPRDARVFLIEGNDELLGAMPQPLRKSAQKQLEDLGVQVRLGVRVDSIREDGVTLSSGEEIDARTVLWAAGVKAVGLGALLGETDRAGRVVVGDDLSVPGHPNIFVVGDMAHVEQDGAQVPGMAPGAIQMGECAAHNIKRRVADVETHPFKYFDKGQMATIGRSRAVAASGPMQFSGFLAWAAWLFIHIWFLIDFRNRLAVMFDWVWAYVTFQRSARVVVGGETHRLLPTDLADEEE